MIATHFYKFISVEAQATFIPFPIGNYNWKYRNVCISYNQQLNNEVVEEHKIGWKNK